MIDPVQVLKDAVQKAGSQKAFASNVGVSPQYVNDLMRGRRAFEGERILIALGLERTVTFNHRTPKRRKPSNV